MTKMRDIIFIQDIVKIYGITHKNIYKLVDSNFIEPPKRNGEMASFWTRDYIEGLDFKNAFLSPYYPIITIKNDDIDQQEQLGSKEKFWCYIEGNDSQWLFKFNQEHTGQHWSEKIAAEIAAVLGMQHAPVELAEFDGRFGSIGESIARNGRQLIHGNQILSGLATGYNTDGRYKLKEYTIENIIISMTKYFQREESININLSVLFGYFLFDALIGNTDRHHENWAITQRESDGKLIRYVAPSFDHASSLGRELIDQSEVHKSKEKILTQNSFQTYAKRARGAIYLSTDDQKPARLFELYRFLLENHTNLCQDMHDRICTLQEKTFESIIDNVPNRAMSDTAKQFVIRLLMNNLSILRDISK